MPTASRSGTRRGSRLNWRTCVSSLSRPGPCARRRPQALTALAAALRALIRFHEAHPEWFPPESRRVESTRPAVLDPEWKAAIEHAYQLFNQGGKDAPPVVSGDSPGDFALCSSAWFESDLTTGKMTQNGKETVKFCLRSYGAPASRGLVAASRQNPTLPHVPRFPTSQ